MTCKALAAFALSQEVWTEGRARHMMAAVVAIASPLEIHTEVIGDTTIFYMGVPSALLTISNILWWAGIILAGFLAYTALVIFLWNLLLSKRGGAWDMEDRLSQPEDDDEQARELQKWREKKGRKRRRGDET